VIFKDLYFFMFTTESEIISCPYCGENIEIVVDGSVEFQQYREDCSVCCQPIVVNVEVDYKDAVNVAARTEQEC